MITIVINPKGREKANFAPVEEFAFFVVPDTGDDVIVRAPGVKPERPMDDDIEDEPLDAGETDEEGGALDRREEATPTSSGSIGTRVVEAAAQRCRPIAISVTGSSIRSS